MLLKRLLSLAGAASLLTPLLLAASPPAGAAALPGPAWTASTGDIHFSSPTVADVNGDGVKDVAIGGLDGILHVLDGKTGSELPGWPQPVVPPNAQGPTAIESSPAIADLDNDGKPEIIVGAGSLNVQNQQGGLVAFNNNGSVRFAVPTLDVFNEWDGHSGPPDGYHEAVFGSPAVGDLNGDGFGDVVFTSFDHRLYAVDRNGAMLPGFPFNNADTIYSSPALFDSDRDGLPEIYFGGDASGFQGCTLGVFRRINPDGNEAWHRCFDTIFQSSPAIGDIDGDGRMEVVTGGGTGGGTDRYKVQALHLDDGSSLPGWPVQMNGQTLTSPAIGDVNNDGKADVVISSCSGPCNSGTPAVWAFRGDGAPLWAVNPQGSTGPPSELVSSPIIADVNGDGVNDVAVGCESFFCLLNGPNGAPLFDPVDGGRAHQSSGAIADFGGGVGWRLVIAGRPGSGGGAGLKSYPLTAPRVTPPWPMFHKDANHTAAPPPPPPFVCSQGYWLGASDGGIFTFGKASFFGSAGAIPLNQPIVGMAVTPSRQGYWLVAADGGIFTYGDARFFGSTGAMHLNQPIVGMAPTADGKGYWLVASDGGIFTFGDAAFLGSTGAMHLNRPIVGMAATPSGGGYWMVATDGGIFTFGDAQFFGSTGAMALNKPIVGMASTGNGGGYWLVASDGGIFTFGNAPFLGSAGAIKLNRPIVAMARTQSGGGYRLVATDGGIFSYGDAEFCGSTGSRHLNKPVNALGTAN